jgi:hypothetical protein
MVGVSIYVLGNLQGFLMIQDNHHKKKKKEELDLVETFKGKPILGLYMFLCLE